MSASIWQILGLEPTRDQTVIRRAYARLLKRTNPEDDAEAFLLLREAYETAMRLAASGAEEEVAAPAEIASVDAAPAEMPPPPAEADPLLEQLNADCSRLADLVRAEPQPSDETLQEALQAVLSCPLLANISIHEQVERGMAMLIAYNAPRSDVLLDQAAAYFNWNAHHGGPYANLIGGIVQRRDDRRFLAEVSAPQHHFHWAFKVLTRPSKRPDFWRGRIGTTLSYAENLLPRTAQTQRIQELLNLIRSRHPSLLDRLNPDTVIRWDRRLATTPFRQWTRTNLMVGLICLAIYLFGGHDSESLAPFVFLTLVECFFYVVIVLPKRLWRLRAATAPPWVHFGWALAVILLPLAAALQAPSLPITIGFGILAALIAFWAFVTGEPDVRAGGRRILWRCLFAEIFLIFWWILLNESMPPAAYLQISLALLPGIIASSFAPMPLFTRWLKLPEDTRRRSLIGLGGLTAMAAGLVLMEGANPLARPLVAASVAVIVLMHRIPLLLLDTKAMRIRAVLLGLSFVVLANKPGAAGFQTFGDPDILARGGWWLLAGVAFTLYYVWQVLKAKQPTGRG